MKTEPDIVAVPVIGETGLKLSPSHLYAIGRGTDPNLSLPHWDDLPEPMRAAISAVAAHAYALGVGDSEECARW